MVFALNERYELRQQSTGQALMMWLRETDATGILIEFDEVVTIDNHKVFIPWGSIRQIDLRRKLIVTTL